jgi:steroid 5-alpha reductase family enzyme
MFDLALAAALFLFTAVTFMWLLSLVLCDAGIVDVFWGLGFVGVFWLTFALAPGTAVPRQWLLGTLVTLWGLRLALHIGRRNWGRPEDFRYARWRAEAGPAWWWRSYIKVFLLQGALLWLVSLPLIAVNAAGGPALGWLDATAVLLWLIGFTFEAGGDWQLTRFKSDPANHGRLLTSGLWRYTRHPNYFGDAVQWWAFFLFAAATGAWWTIVSPLVMTTLLRRVSGVTLLERTLHQSKPGYAAYMARTNAFFPGRPEANHEI